VASTKTACDAGSDGQLGNGTNSNSLVPVEYLLDEVWGPEYSGQIEHVKHYIWSLRQKIERDPGDPEHIITERGFGYRFE
jgi:DNA-binding response OmpR family regulator